MTFKHLSTLAAIALISGCALLPGAQEPDRTNRHGDDESGRCARLYAQVDAEIADAGVTDAQSARVPGFPYLRINRFLAAIQPSSQDAGFGAWLDQLQRLDEQARQLEMANLNASADTGRAAQLQRCAPHMRQQDMSRQTNLDRLARASGGSAYRPALRAWGAYPLVSVPFLAGVHGLHEETRQTFSTPLEQLPVQGALIRYSAAEGDERLTQDKVAHILRRASANPLRIPLPAPQELRQLLNTFAPVWEIDVASTADRPGQPRLRRDGMPTVDGQATVYTLVSHSRWQGRNLLQLNYVIWFPERPRQGSFDLVGGHMDGITWRVTLAADGAPLFQDAMHNCGCYHMVFASPAVTAGDLHDGWEEPLLIAGRLPATTQRQVLRVAATTHYLQRVYPWTPVSGNRGDTRHYVLADYDALRSLPLEGGGRRSLFGAHGIVAGTERGERWLFWPMGVRQPGAMRQWGQHAIAFVGQRHFDDPHLFERYFSGAD